MPACALAPYAAGVAVGDPLLPLARRPLDIFGQGALGAVAQQYSEQDGDGRRTEAGSCDHRLKDEVAEGGITGDKSLQPVDRDGEGLSVPPGRVFDHLPLEQPQFTEEAAVTAHSLDMIFGGAVVLDNRDRAAEDDHNLLARLSFPDQDLTGVNCLVAAMTGE